METFRILEKVESGDLMLMARGDSLEALFRAAARGLFETMVDTDAVRPQVGKEVALSADSIDRLLDRWLLELIRLYEAESLMFGAFEVTMERGAQHRLQGVAMGELIDPTRHAIRDRIGGIRTRPAGILRGKGGVWEVTVVFIPERR